MLNRLIKTLPIPICGLILGIVSLGNLVKLNGYTNLGNSIGCIGIILVLGIIFKIVFTVQDIRESLTNPIIASVSPTFTMAIMVICTYLVGIPIMSNIAKFLWYLAIIIYFILVIYFTKKFVFSSSLSMQELYPSWFIVYVGMGVISVTSGPFSKSIGQFVFYIAVIGYIFLLPFVLNRIFIYKNIQKESLPLITILAAPGSLCLAGYINAFTSHNTFIVLSLLVISQTMYLIVLSQLPKIMSKDFYPSYAAYTFPLVISAIAITSTIPVLSFSSSVLHILKGIAYLETFIAFFMVFYVLFRYLHFLYHNIKKNK
ncbi:MAG: TDT family transporter [Coprobacillaceae bacterium]